MQNTQKIVNLEGEIKKIKSELNTLANKTLPTMKAHYDRRIKELEDKVKSS